MRGGVVRLVLTGVTAVGFVGTATAHADPPANDFNTAPKHPGACTLTWGSKTAATDPDLDITRATLHLTADALVVTTHVAELADHPAGSTGHGFTVEIGWREPGGRSDGAGGEDTQDVVTGTSTVNEDSYYGRDLHDTSVHFDTDASE